MSVIVEDTPTTGQKFAGEVLGTFVLVFFGCGTAIYSGGDLVATGLAFGLTVLVMAYAFGRISGGHFNPAVTLGAVLGGRLPWSQVGIFMAAQLLGALLAGAALFGLGHGFEGFVAEGNMGQNFYGDQGSGFAWWAALLLELLMTAVFVWVILAVTDARNEVNVALGPLAIGLALAMIHFASIPLTGTSVNPARSIGVGVFDGTDAIVQLWLFIVAPLVGGALGGLLYPLVFGHGTEPVPGSGLVFGRPAAAAAVPGYGAPDQFQQEWNQQAAEQAAWEQEPIIQDGWQWDHAAQEWKPLEQWQAAPPAQHTPTATTDPSVAPVEQPDPGTGTTQIRPPE
jgi:aquaporin Z